MTYQIDSLVDQTELIMNRLLRAQGIQSTTIISDPPLSKAQSFSSFSSHSLSKQISKRKPNSPLDEQQYMNKKKQSSDLKNTKKLSYTPIIWQLQNTGNQFFVYGGICIDFSHKTTEDTPTKRLLLSIDRTEYFKNRGLIVFHFGKQSPTIKDLAPLIKRALSVPDYDYYKLSQALEQYQQKIPQMLAIGQENLKTFKSENLLDFYETSYQKFQEWALGEVLKLDTSRMFGFSLHKYNIYSGEFEVQKVGQSSALMAVRGIDLNHPCAFSRKEVYHFLDGESNIKLLIGKLTRIVNGSEFKPTISSIVTFDGLKLEVSMSSMQLTNRDLAFPYYQPTYESRLQGFKFEFMINMVFYDIPMESLRKLIDIRQKRDPLENSLFDDFTYSLESVIFLEKFYKESIQKLRETSNETNSLS